MAGPPGRAVRDRRQWTRAKATADESVRATGRHDRHQVQVCPAGPAAGRAFEAAREAVERYRIYPPSLVKGVVATPSGRVEPGALILQAAGVWPLRVACAVRVVKAAGKDSGATRDYVLSYVTLEGHPERGLIEFRLRLDPSGVTFTIESWSLPGRWWSRLFGPLARQYQRRANLGALGRVRKAAMAAAGA